MEEMQADLLGTARAVIAGKTRSFVMAAQVLAENFVRSHEAVVP